MASFIGVDLGTSFIKGAVLDPERLTIEHIHRVPFPDALPGLPPQQREFSPSDVLAATRRLLDKLLPVAPECEAILMCSQMHGLVFTTELGEPRSNLTTWQDQRVLEPHPSGQGTYFDVLVRQLTRDEVRQLGNEVRPGQPLGVLFWLAEQGRLPGADLVLASLPDFVLSNLCETTPGIEATNAAAHGALNLETMAWHDPVIHKLGLGSLRWPRMRSQGEVVGLLRAGGRSIPCFTPVGDYQCALTGALLRNGELSLNISTGSQVSTLQEALAFGDYQSRPFFDGRFLAGITHIPAGRALNALVKLLSELATGQGVVVPEPWDYITQMARNVDPPQMHANLAFFTSSCGDRGEFTNMREEEMTVGHVFRAAFQNMVDNYYASAQRLHPGGPDGASPWRNLVFSGGLAQKVELLRDLIVDRFGVPYRVCPTPEDSLLGLLALGLAFTGRTPTVAAAMNRIYDAYGGDSMLQ
ncbi:MAG: hypothetical protein H6649_06600 [Caldilineae bacterium]|nr:hypothetical protein [Caldilineae bacterium]